MNKNEVHARRNAKNHYCQVQLAVYSAQPIVIGTLSNSTTASEQLQLQLYLTVKTTSSFPTS